MGKLLKDIIDEGFTKLEGLAEKRREILTRAEKVIKEASDPQSDLLEGKMKAAESSSVAEMSTRVDKLMHELRHSLTEQAESNAIFTSGIKNSLKMHGLGIHNELNQTKAHYINGASERLDSLISELEKDSVSFKRNLGSELAKILFDLNSFCKSNQSSLMQSQSDIEAKISLRQHELNTLLGTTFNEIVGEAEQKRKQVNDFLDNLYRRQLEKMDAETEELHGRISKVVKEHLDNMKDSCLSVQKAFHSKQEATLLPTIDRLKTSTETPISELEKLSEDRRNAMSQKSIELREYRSNLLKQHSDALSERESNSKSNTDAFCAELLHPSSGRSKIDEAFAELSTELSTLTEELQTKMKDLVKAQSDGLTKLNASTRRSYIDLFSDFKTQFRDVVRTQEQLCEEKEEELVRQLENLDKQIEATYAFYKASGYTPKFEHKSSNGGSKE